MQTVNPVIKTPLAKQTDVKRIQKKQIFMRDGKRNGSLSIAFMAKTRPVGLSSFLAYLAWLIRCTNAFQQL